MDVLAVSDPAAGVGLVAAFLAGMVSFLSPCVLPLVPGYLSAVSGVSVDELDDAGWRRVLLPSLCFVASFSLIFILLGLTATKLGSILSNNRELLDKIAAALIIAMGVLFVASFFVAKLNREWHVDALMSRAGKGGPVVAGAAFAFAWTPCIGPTLGAILSAASLSGSAANGALLLAVYSAGLGIPFLLAAFFSGAFMRFLARFRVHLGKVEKVMGGLLVVAGILFMTGGMQSFSFWLLETFPVFQSIG